MTYSFEKSAELNKQAFKSLVGGVNSPVRSFSKVGGTPIFATKAEGAYIFDADNNKYIDFVLSYGPHLFGHAHSAINSKVKAALDKGSCFGMTSEAEIKWAEKIISLVPSAEFVRAMNSGTESCMTALRVARSYTRRDIVVKFSGHYHGHIDALLCDTGSGAATLSSENIADSTGIPQKVFDDIRVLPFNDICSLRKLFELEGSKIAAIIMEPVMGNMGVIPATQEFTDECRKICTQNKSLLIFDEVMTGFRVSAKSAQGAYNITPDLTCMGKVVGGGMPLSALVGKKEFMMELSPVGGAYQAGTLSGNPIAINAGLAMLELVESENPFEKLDLFAGELTKHIESLIEKKAINACVSQKGSMFSVFFRKEKPLNAADARDVDMDMFNKYFWSCIHAGIMLPPSPFEAYFLSVSHLSLKDEIFSKFEKAFKSL